MWDTISSMIIGFLGKGGSGKSTVATLCAKYLLENNKVVLAVDNDHNMDFSYNLGASSGKYIGQGLKDVFSFMGIQSTTDTLALTPDTFFSLSPKDPITEKYTTEKGRGLHIMMAGPHTEDIMIGRQCSHVLTTPLKAYLPFLKVGKDEYVLVDEKAGADGVGTGITTGFTMAIVVVEPTPHGVKAALQISKMLRFYNTPYVYILNKAREAGSLKEIEKQLDKKIFGFIPYSEEVLDLSLGEQSRSLFSELLKTLEEMDDTRKQRSKSRLQRLADAQ